MNDLVWVFIFFLIMLLVRSIMTMIFYPYLAKLGYGNLGTTNPFSTKLPTNKLTRISRPLPGTSPKDAAFMVWAGLRGAVGLALALVVSQSGGDQRHGKQGQ